MSECKYRICGFALNVAKQKEAKEIQEDKTFVENLTIPQYKQTEVLKVFDDEKCEEQIKLRAEVALIAIPRGIAAPGYRKVKLNTAYLGEVAVDCFDFGSGHVALQSCMPNGMWIKCLDAVVHRLNPQQQQYPISYLQRLNPTILNVAENHALGRRLPYAEANNSFLDWNLRQLGPVDIHFVTIEYNFFAAEHLGLPKLNDKNICISFHHIIGLDNAFYHNNCMAYGDGNKIFKILCSADCGAHELTHGVVERLVGLIYAKFSGAINEHYSDAVAACFEYYLYKKYNNNSCPTDDLKGEWDYFIGEDFGKAMPYMRNMAEPTKAAHPQPDFYRGKYWADETNMAVDNGGVHSNSGPLNKCFYLASQKLGMFNALHIWMKALRKLTPNATFINFRDALICSAGVSEGCITTCLNQIGLSKDAI